eukprot:scaffold263834_cov35-Tisochrysis_lutea.AAC.1
MTRRASSSTAPLKSAGSASMTSQSSPPLTSSTRGSVPIRPSSDRDEECDRVEACMGDGGTAGTASEDGAGAKGREREARAEARGGGRPEARSASSPSAAAASPCERRKA